MGVVARHQPERAQLETLIRKGCPADRTGADPKALALRLRGAGNLLIGPVGVAVAVGAAARIGKAAVGDKALPLTVASILAYQPPVPVMQRMTVHLARIGSGGNPGLELALAFSKDGFRHHLAN